MSYGPVKAVSVFLWGRRVGVLAHARDQYSVFEYDPEFHRSGLEIAPFAMPLSRALYSADDFELPRRAFYGVPGVFADSLPDSFGNQLVKKWMVSHGVDLSAVTPLDRLVYVGSRGMGALTYEPEMRRDGKIPTSVDMSSLVQEAHLALNGNLLQMGGDDALREIIRLGSSAGGAQAKAIVGWNRSVNSYVTGDVDLPEGFEHWIVKFSPKALPDAGRREYEIYLKARKAGIDMSESRLLTIDGCSHFMTKRFDREGARRFHLQTLCALRHLPPVGPRELYSYETLFETANQLGLDYEAREEIFRRMAFNVYNKEMDDHTKNFSFLMTEDGVWHLAPAYDLTGEHFSEADDAWGQWQNQHALSVNGKFSNITDEDLLSVGERWAVGSAPRVLQAIQKVFK